MNNLEEIEVKGIFYYIKYMIVMFFNNRKKQKESPLKGNKPNIHHSYFPVEEVKTIPPEAPKAEKEPAKPKEEKPIQEKREVPEDVLRSILKDE